MAHPLNRSFRLIAGATIIGFITTAVIVVSAMFVGERLVAMQTANAANAPAQSEQALLTVNREGKGDRLSVPATAQTRNEIKSVEVIGLSNASIVYRDRSGNVLYQTDPLANVTVVTKNVDLPEVTIRESDKAKVERIPVEEARPSARPHGCESAFARPSPESLTRTSSRCVTQMQRATNFAAVN